MKLTDIKAGSKLELEIYNGLGDRIKPVFVSEFEWTEDEKVAVIAAPIHEGVILPVHFGAVMDVYLQYKADNISKMDIYRFRAVVNDRGTADNIAILKISITGDMEKIQRRQFFRFDCSRPITYGDIMTIDLSNKDQPSPRNAITKDLSGGGLCILTENAVELNKTLEFELQLEDDSNVRFYGKVVRVSKTEISSKFKYEWGILFRKIDNKDREAIIKYIFNEQRKLRKKGLI